MWNSRNTPGNNESVRLLRPTNTGNSRSAMPTRNAAATTAGSRDESRRLTCKDIFMSCVVTPFSFGSGLFGAISILLTTISVSFVIFLTVHITDMTSAISNSINIAIMTLSIITIVLFHVFQRKIRLNHQRRTSSKGMTHAIRKNIILIGITLFCFLSVFLDIYHLIAEYSCSTVWISCGEVVERIYRTKVGFHYTRLIFMTAETVFCWFFRQTKFRHSCAVSYGLVVIIAANCSVWFDSLLYEIDERFSEPNVDERTKFCHESRVQTPLEYSCHHHNTTAYSRVKDTIDPYFYPITIEHSLLVVEWLFEKFLYFGPSLEHDLVHQQNSEGRSSREAHGGERGNARELVPVNTDRSPPDRSSETDEHQRCPTIQIVYTMQALIFILYCIASGLNSSKSPDDSDAVYRNIYFAFKIFYSLIQISSILLGFIVGRRFSSSSDLQTVAKHFDGYKAFVVFSSMGLFAQKFFVIVATCSMVYFGHNTQNVSPGLLLTADFVSVVEVVYQIQFLIYCQTIVKRNGSACHRHTFDAVLSLLAICNFGSWFANSFLLVNVDSSTDDFYKSNWKLLCNVVAPFTLFFHFNSMVLFLKVYLKDNSHSAN